MGLKKFRITNHRNSETLGLGRIITGVAIYDAFEIKIEREDVHYVEGIQIISDWKLFQISSKGHGQRISVKSMTRFEMSKPRKVKMNDIHDWKLQVRFLTKYVLCLEICDEWKDHQKSHVQQNEHFTMTHMVGKRFLERLGRHEIIFDFRSSWIDRTIHKTFFNLSSNLELVGT